ncbi:unnamed protein product [Lampetra planeri]
MALSSLLVGGGPGGQRRTRPKFPSKSRRLSLAYRFSVKGCRCRRRRRCCWKSPSAWVSTQISSFPPRPLLLLLLSRLLLMQKR